MTFAEFCTAVKATVFPEGEPENLVTNHRKYIVDACIDLQQKIPGMRIQHEDNTEQGDTYFHCGATMLPAPRGFIHNVWTITNTDCCSKVLYRPVDIDEFRSYLEDDHDCAGPDDLDLAYAYPDDSDGPGCLYTSDPSGSIDKSNRAQAGVVTVWRNLIYLYPHLQSDEIVVVEWDGIKRSWDDAENVTWDREIEDAVENYLESKTSGREDSNYEKKAIAWNEYTNLVAKLIWQYNKENRIPLRRPLFTNCGYVNSCLLSTGTSSSTSSTSVTCDPVNTFAELRANVNPITCKAIIVNGKASAFDGGGGVFIAVAQTTPATADDATNYIASSLNAAYFWQKLM